MAYAESSQTDRKRPRLSEPEEEKPFLQHATLYFDDGNVILRTGRTLFCVHKSLLSKHSPVFRDLFEQPHGRFRGLLHVEMGETPEEVEALVNVIYDGLRIDIDDLTVETFPTLANILRMATKYKIPRPCEDIIARFRAEWPSTLAQHDTKESDFRARMVRIYGGAYGKGAANMPAAQGAGGPVPPAVPEEDTIVHPASVIALLRDCNYHDTDLLFPLFYRLSCTTWQFGGSSLGHHLAPLLPVDVERLVVGIERLRAAHVACAVEIPTFPQQPTNPPHFCMAGVAQLWASFTPPLLLGSLRNARRPLEQWRAVMPMVEAHEAQFHVCNLCARAITAKIEGIRQYLWGSLPFFFDLP